MPNRIVANVIPLFGIALERSQHVIEKFLLPDEPRYAKLALYALAGPFFPKSKKDREPLGIKLWSAEEMDMIRHDHVTANCPAMTLVCRAPFVDQNSCDSLRRENCLPTISTRRDEIDRVLNPDPLQSFEVLVHAEL
jgi:hypothetical protein